jgi:RNA polymerase sigma factor (sigma-70 family)
MRHFDHERALWLSRNIMPHEGALRAWLRRKRHLPIDVDDIVQECYAILAGLERVDHIARPKAYLFQTADSLVLRDLRRAKVVSIRAVDDLDALGAVAEEPSPESQIAAREELARLAEALDRLPSQCREAFKLRKIDGYSQREIAQKMGLSESTVEKHIAKALRLLMDAFGRRGNPPLHASSNPRTGVKSGHGQTRE